MLAGALHFTRKRAAVMVVCWLAYVVIYLLRSNLAVALPYIGAQFRINKTSLGLLGSVFMWVYGVGHLVNGNIGDRFPAKVFIAVGIGMAALLNCLFAVANRYWVMVLLWGANGWFAAMLWGPIVKTISLWYPPEQSGGVVVAVSTSMTVGGLLSLMLSRSLSAPEGWRMIFFAPAGIALCFLLLHLLLFRNAPARQELGQELAKQHVPPSPKKVRMVDLLLKTRIRYVVLSCLAQGIVKDGIALWATVYFVENFGLDIKSAVLTVVLIPVMNFLGVLAVGWLYKRYPKRLERLTACTFGMGMALMTGLLLMGNQSLLVSTVLLALASAAMYGANTLLLGIFPISYSYCGRVSAVAGFLDFCAYMASGLAAVLCGLLVDKMGWGGVMALWLGVTAMGMAALLVAEGSKVTYELP